MTRLAAATFAGVLVLGPLWYFGVIFPHGRSAGDLRQVERVASPNCARKGAVCARTLPAPPSSPANRREQESFRPRGRPSPEKPPLPEPAATVREPAGDAASPARVTVAYDTADFRFGYLARVTIHNSGDTPIKGWMLRMRLRTGALIGAKGASVSMSPEGWMTAVNESSTAVVNPGGSVSFTYTNDGDPDWSPAGCTINGATCSGGW